jgi:hypothetical protein
MDMPETVRFRFTSPVTYRGLDLIPGSEAEVSVHHAERWAKKGLGEIVGVWTPGTEETPREGENTPLKRIKTTKKKRVAKKKQGRSTE